MSCSHLIQCRTVMRAKSSASTEDERAELWDSPDSSATNSQCSLADLVSPLPTCSPHCSPVVPRQHSVRVRAAAHLLPSSYLLHSLLLPSQRLGSLFPPLTLVGLSKHSSSSPPFSHFSVSHKTVHGPCLKSFITLPAMHGAVNKMMVMYYF